MAISGLNLSLLSLAQESDASTPSLGASRHPLPRGGEGSRPAVLLALPLGGEGWGEGDTSLRSARLNKSPLQGSPTRRVARSPWALPRAKLVRPFRPDCLSSRVIA